jgi:pyrimidine operon attenuation protein/uracil phosphoribosyltransferase
MSDERELKIAGAADVETLLDELAARIAAAASPDTLLIGILRRGKPLADMLAQRIEHAHGPALRVGALKLKRYSDKLDLLHDRPKIETETLDVEVEGRHLILVDDVLYTGESMFRAACRMRAAGATFIQTAFLCTRAGRRMPLHADFVGGRFDVPPDWVIHCEVPPYENELGISLAHQEAVRGG